MQRRREHMECESKTGLGCLVYGTSVCTHRRKPVQRLKRWLRSRLTIELWWVLLAMVPLIISWVGYHLTADEVVRSVYPMVRDS